QGADYEGPPDRHKAACRLRSTNPRLSCRAAEIWKGGASPFFGETTTGSGGRRPQLPENRAVHHAIGEIRHPAGIGPVPPNKPPPSSSSRPGDLRGIHWQYPSHMLEEAEPRERATG